MLTLDATNARIPNSEKYCTVPIVVPKMCTVKQSYNTHSNSQYLVSPSLLPLVQMGVLSTGLHKWVPKRYYLRYCTDENAVFRCDSDKNSLVIICL